MDVWTYLPPKLPQVGLERGSLYLDPFTDANEGSIILNPRHSSLVDGIEHGKLTPGGTRTVPGIICIISLTKAISI